MRAPLPPLQQPRVSSDSHRHTAPTGPLKCPSTAAACVKVGDSYTSLGQVDSAPTWDQGVLKLQYSSGQACPDGRRNRSSIIRFKCDPDKVVSGLLHKA